MNIREDSYAWEEIRRKLISHLKRRITTYDEVSPVILEFILLYEKQQEEIVKLKKELSAWRAEGMI